jgi:tetratricopeptide (TPR) repeat protein
MAAVPVLRVFLSSPGDLVEERKLAREALEALEASHLLRGKMRFEIVAWDDEHAAAPMDARETPQISVNRYTGRPADCDLTLVFLWSRIGTRLPPGVTRSNGTPYESGTVWEYEDALAADKPVYVYRRTEKPKIELDDADLDKKRAQYAAVKAFFDGFQKPDGSLSAGFTSYATPPDFAKILRQHLEAFVNERMGTQVQAATGQIGPDDIKVSQILTLIDEIDRKNRQLDQKDAAIEALTQENEALRRAAVARTLNAAAQPEAGAEVRAAGVALEIGDTGPAEVLLRGQEEAAAQPLQAGGPQTDERRQQAAELAREQGALAIGRDVRVALAAYLRAARYEPDDARTLFTIGDLYVKLGNLNAAMRNYQASLAVARKLAASDPSNSQWQRDLSVSHDMVGETQCAQGDLTGALESYHAGMAIRQKLAATDPSQSHWQRDVSVSYNKIGETQSAQGDLIGALNSYQSGMAIVQKLAASDASNSQWQRDLSVSYNKIGETQSAQGDLIGALNSYQSGMTIVQKLASSDPSNSQWQRDLSVSYNKIGETQSAQGELAEAMKSYQAGMAIVQKLAAIDPNNTEWQRDLSVSHNKIGEVQQAQGNLAGALQSYQAYMTIAQNLVANDPSNNQWQRDLSVSYNKVGETQSTQGELAEALTSYQANMAIAQKLAASDPSNSQWQRDLGVSNNKIGDTQSAQGELVGALKSYRAGMTIAQNLVASDPSNSQWQRDLSFSYSKIGDTQSAQGDHAAALKSYQASMAIRQNLAASDPSNSQCQTDVAVSAWKIGTLKASSQSKTDQRAVLMHGLRVLDALAQRQRLAPTQAGWPEMFRKAIAQLQ